MSKLSATLKALVHADFARPGTTAASAGIRAVFEHIAHDAAARNIALPGWLAISRMAAQTAATMTMNSPESLAALFHVGARPGAAYTPLQVAEFMREVGLKCISFNGIPRTINCLAAFRASLPDDVQRQLTHDARRQPTSANVDDLRARGQALWKAIYAPFDEKLVKKLALSHPDLPVHILNSHYGALLADPAGDDKARPNVGRVLTSLVAVACLRAQSGVAPQVVSHLFGLRKAYENGEVGAPGVEQIAGGDFLASDEGNIWILTQVDRIVQELGGEHGTTYAAGYMAKL